MRLLVCRDVISCKAFCGYGSWQLFTEAPTSTSSQADRVLLCFCFSKMMGAVIQRSELVLLFAFKCAGNKLRICCRAAASVVFINKKESVRFSFLHLCRKVKNEGFYRVQRKQKWGLVMVKTKLGRWNEQEKILQMSAGNSKKYYRLMRSNSRV